MTLRALTDAQIGELRDEFNESDGLLPILPFRWSMLT
jgi:hypothetical protein